MPPRNPHAIVEIGGDRYDSWIDKQFFKQLTVELASNIASQALFRCFDPRFRFIDKYTTDDGVPHLPFKAWMGYGEDLGPAIFKGLLTRVGRVGPDTVFIVFDMGVKMRQEKTAEYHRNLNELEIIYKIAKRRGLNVVGPEDTSELTKHDSYIQSSQNDWELAMELARHSGWVLYVRGDTLFIKDPAKVDKPILTLRYRKHFDFLPDLLHNFDLEYKLPENQDGRHQVVEMYTRGRGGRRLTGVSTKHRRGHKKFEATEEVHIHDKPTANRHARAVKNLQREHAFALDIRSTSPLPGVRPDVRDTIALEGLGKLWSGPYLCDKVIHDLTGQGFATQYSLYRDTLNG